MALQVIGAGFARTGTMSMQGALNTLGLGPTYHMNDVFQIPSHAQLWLDYGESKTADCNRWLGFWLKCTIEAFADWP